MTQNIFDLVDVWNDAAVTFNAIKMNVTDTASDAESLLMDLQVGGVSKVNIAKNANLYVNGTFLTGGNGIGCRIRSGAGNNGLYVDSAGIASFVSGFVNFAVKGSSYVFFRRDMAVGWTNEQYPNLSATLDLALNRDAADTLAQRRTTFAQTFRLYNTWSDEDNYERLSIGWDTNVVSIKPENAGTGSARDLHISGLPTSNPGPGILWNNAGTPAIGT